MPKLTYPRCCRLLLKSFGLLAPSILTAQVETGLYTPVPNFCTPGVANNSPAKGLLLNYSYQPAYQLRLGEQGVGSVKRNEIFNFKLKAPLLNKPKTKVIAGVHYGLQSYAFDVITPGTDPTLQWFDERNLKTAVATLYLTQSLNASNYLSWRASVSWQGDWKGFLHPTRKQAQYSLAGLWGIKRRQDLEYGFGLRLSYDARGFMALPFGMYNRTFNKHWGIESTLPVKIMGRYNFSESQLLLFGAEYLSDRYYLEDQRLQVQTNATVNPAALQFRDAAIELSTTYQQRLTNWTWLEFKAGYAINANSRLDDPTTGARLPMNTNNRFCGGISFFVSPPRR